MSQPDKEENIDEEAYQLMKRLLEKTRQINNLNDGYCNQDSQENNHVAEKALRKLKLYTVEYKRKSRPYPEPVGALMTDINLQKSDDEGLLSDLAHTLEKGCMLVEYDKTESSWEAARCLRRLLFDDRTVTIEYISEDLYVAKFGKV